MYTWLTQSGARGRLESLHLHATIWLTRSGARGRLESLRLHTTTCYVRSHYCVNESDWKICGVGRCGFFLLLETIYDDTYVMLAPRYTSGDMQRLGITSEAASERSCPPHTKLRPALVVFPQSGLLWAPR